jgi:hypothetical protein
MIIATKNGREKTGKPVSRFPFGPTGFLRSSLPLAVSLFVLPGIFWPAYEFIERNDSGFHYRDYKGSPYDQMRVPDEGINQIQCPPSQRPYCGDR